MGKRLIYRLHRVSKGALQQLLAYLQPVSGPHSRRGVTE